MPTNTQTYVIKPIFWNKNPTLTRAEKNSTINNEKSKAGKDIQYNEWMSLKSQDTNMFTF